MYSKKLQKIDEIVNKVYSYFNFLQEGFKIGKKFIFRKNTDKLNIKNAPKHLEYNVWYNLVTLFDWQYFKVKKGSKYVYIYDCIKDNKPCLILTKDIFRLFENRKVHSM